MVITLGIYIWRGIVIYILYNIYNIYKPIDVCCMSLILICIILLVVLLIDLFIYANVNVYLYRRLGACHADYWVKESDIEKERIFFQNLSKTIYNIQHVPIKQPRQFNINKLAR